MGVVHGIFTLILTVEFITGSLGNGFIAVVNCKDWVKRRKISSVDQILTALAISRIGLLWSTVIILLTVLPSSGLWIPPSMFKIMTVLWTIPNHLSIWLATCLIIFYFLKIANFSNSIFLYLKWRVKNVISVALFVCLLLLILNIMLVKILLYDLTDSYKTNISYSSSSRNFTQISKLLLIYTVSSSIPFTLSLVAFVLLIFSLRKHHRRMQHNARGCRDASTMAHLKALQTVIAFLILYTIFFLSFLIQVWKNELAVKNLTILFCQVATVLFPSCHSFVLILENRKLRQTCLLVLKQLRCRSKAAEFSGP